MLCLIFVALSVLGCAPNAVSDYYNDYYITMEACPKPFTEFNDKCYIKVENSTVCPYHLPLPFDQYEDIARDLGGCLINATKNIQYDYYEWLEMGGNYHKLFTGDLDGVADLVAVNYTNNNTSFATVTNYTDYPYICAYDSLLNANTTSYCELYDKICARKIHSALNCHCLSLTHAYFCELKCDRADFNQTNCTQCDSIYADYKTPSLSLSMSYYKSRIFVSIMYYMKLLPIEKENDTLVYCFTDAEHSLNDVTYRYNFSKDSITTYNDSFKQIHYYIDPREYYIGHYWCEAFEILSGYLNPIASEPIIATQFGETNIESFTVNVTVSYDNDTVLYPLTIHETTEDFLENVTKETGIISEVQFLKLYPRNYSTTSRLIAYRLYLNATNESMMDVLDVLDTIKDILNGTMKVTENINITLDKTGRGPSYCLPDNTTQADNNITLHWDKALLGMTVLPRELCLQEDGSPVTRTCMGEYLYGCYWSDVNGACVENSGELYGSAKSIPLHEMVYSNISSGEKIDNLKLLNVSEGHHLVVDAHFMAQLIESITLSSDNFDLQSLIETVSDVMDLERGVLHEAQNILNTTDLVLYSLDSVLNSRHFYNRTDVFIAKSKNIYLQVSKLADYNITGAAFYETDNESLEVRPITNDIDLGNIDKTGLKLAAFVTDTQLIQLRSSNNPEALLIVVLFRDDSLFNQAANPTTTGSLVGLYVTGFEEPFMYDWVRVLIKPDRKYRADLVCHFWKYGRNKQWYNIRGKWTKENTSFVLDDEWYYCKFWHMTHYGILVGMEDSLVLSIVAAVGCGLSTLGATGVVVTGIVYKSWRDTSGAKILLNFVLTMIVQNVILSVSSPVDGYIHESVCVFVGAVLHYCVCAQFSWMMVIGYLQYQRYVKVFFTVNNRFVLMVSLAAWGLPVIPVVVVLASHADSYIQKEFCYLQDEPLFFAVFVPVSMSLTFSIFVFVAILYNIYSRKSNTHGTKDSVSLLNLRLIILLFFLLGLYWVFGIAARFSGLVALDYFFCLSAALQGLVVFVYFIVFNKMTKNFWMRQLKIAKMMTVMRIWLHKKRSIGSIKLDKSRNKTVKVEIANSLQEKQSLNKST